MRQFARALALAAFSALTAEFLLGDQWLGGFAPPGTQIAQFVLYVAFYGSAAVLIREVARRTGRGWPSMLLLALAFGVFEEGVVDQSLFATEFAGQHLLAYGWLPALGMGGPWTVFVLSLHVIWSIGSPIAIAEAVFPRPLPKRPAVAPQRQAPWLGGFGLVVAAALMVLGGGAILAFTALMGGGAATPAQLIGSVVVAAALVAVAVLLPRRAPRGVRGTGASWAGLVLSLGVTSAYMVVWDTREAFSPWLCVVLQVALLAGGAVVVAVLRAAPAFVGAGAVLTYCWVGMLNASHVGPGAVVEQMVVVAIAVGVAVVAVVRGTRVERRESAGASLGWSRG